MRFGVALSQLFLKPSLPHTHEERGAMIFNFEKFCKLAEVIYSKFD